MPASPVLSALFRDFVYESLSQTLDTLWEDFAQMLRDEWDAVPNPWKMADVLFLFATSLSGRVISAPFSGVEGWLLRMTKAAGYNSRVLTVPAAIKLVVRSHSEVVTNLTGTSSSSLASALGRSAGLWMWSIYKRFKFLRSVVSWRTEADVISYFITKFRSRVRLFGVALLFIAVFSVVAWIGAVALLIGIGISLLSGEFGKYLLAQDSKRVWNKKAGVRRQNRRRGPDQPQ